MKTLRLSIIMVGILILSISSFDMSSAQSQNSTNSKCMNMTEIDKSIVPPHGEELPMFKNYALGCTTVSGSAIQMEYVPNVTPVANLQTNLNSQSMIEIIPGSGNDISATVSAGQSAHVPVKIQVKDGYGMSSVQFSMINLPPRVQSWTDPRDSGFLANQPVNGSLANATINIYVDSGAKSGSYYIGIAADGSMIDSAGKYIQLNQSEIGMLHLTISGQDNIWSDVGLPDVHQDTMCLDTGNGGKSCSGFPAYEEYPVTVYGEGQKVTMSVPDLPAGKYVRFVPGDVTATPGGTSVKMIAAGIVRPGAPNALFTPVATIVAQSSDGTKSSSYIPIAEIQNITVIHSPGPIAFADNFGGDGQQGFGISGVVYDPKNYTGAPLHVKLSVLGIDNGTITPMPSWLSMSIPDSSFDLVPTVPYYFMLNFSSTNASLGTYPVAIKEDMGDSSFVQDVMIKIYNPPRFGGVIMGPSITPIATSVSVTSNDVDNAIVLALVGVPIAAGVSIGVLLFARKKK